MWYSRSTVRVATAPVAAFFVRTPHVLAPLPYYGILYAIPYCIIFSSRLLFLFLYFIVAVRTVVGVVVVLGLVVYVFVCYGPVR